MAASTSTGAASPVPVRPGSATVGPTRSMISAALGSNVALQSELKGRLLRIRRARVRNRMNAARVWASISQCRNDYAAHPSGGDTSPRTNDNLAAGPTSQGDVVRHSAENRERRTSIDGQDAPSSRRKDDGDSPKADAHGIDEDFVRRPSHPDRKITRGFFVDKDGFTPEAKLELKLEEKVRQTAMPIMRMEFDRFKNLKTSSSPSKQPPKSWEKKKKKNWPNSSFAEVAITIGGQVSPDEEEEGERLTARFTFANSSISKTKFTKKECLFMMSMSKELGDGGRGSIDWYEMASRHYAEFKRQTPWLCFSHYRSSLQNPVTRCPPWSPEEDELLLKYLAAHGPQFILQGDPLDEICRNLFPLRTSAQIRARANSTLLNPNYVQDAWSIDEKRRLALLMRIFSENPRPINCASRVDHFPRRSPKMVLEKWTKSLDPALSHCPYTSDEDQRIRESLGEWLALKSACPDRPVLVAKRRWAEIADEGEVAASCEGRIIRRALSRRGRVAGSDGNRMMGAKDFLVVSRPLNPAKFPRTNVNP